MTPRDKANNARISAAQKYRMEALMLWGRGNALHDLDPEGACALWLDGMCALDCALITEQGLKGG